MIRWCDNGHAPLRVQSGQRCRACDTRREASRPSAAARGYDMTHRNARAELRATLPAPCGYGCGVTLWPNGAWVAAHVRDGQPEYGWIASCRECNERAKHGGGRSGSGERPAAIPAPSQFAVPTGSRFGRES